MPALPQVYDTAVQRIKVSAVATGLVNPWSLAFLPNGDMLVTERPGRLRIVRNGVLDPTPIAGTPVAHVAALAGLLEVALHPRFAENRVVYLTYSKGRAEDKRSTTALARATFDGKALVGPEGHLRRQHLERVEHQLRRPHRLRPRRFPLSHRRRAAGAGPRAEARGARGQGAAAARRRHRAARQPVCGQAGIPAGDLHDRPPQPAGAGAPSRDRASCGRTSTARSAATSSTSSSRAPTTAGRSSPTAPTTTAPRSAR